jgi:hypothetical protein
MNESMQDGLIKFDPKTVSAYLAGLSSCSLNGNNTAA